MPLTSLFRPIQTENMILFSRNMNYRDVSFKTHQPRTVNDSGNGTMNHFWDANGNLALSYPEISRHYNLLI